MPHGASLQLLCAAYVSIIAFSSNILMIRAEWRKPITIARRIREYYSIWHGHSAEKCFYSVCASIIGFRVAVLIIGALWREPLTILRRMRQYYCLRHGFSDNGCCTACAEDSRCMRKYYRLRGYCNNDQPETSCPNVGQEWDAKHSALFEFAKKIRNFEHFSKFWFCKS